MRVCPSCRLALRVNDPGFGVQNLGQNVIMIGAAWPLGGYDVCWDCYKQINPDARPLTPPRPYDTGKIDTPAEEMMSSYFCPCCRVYSREDDPIAQVRTLRILQEDLDNYPDLKPRPRPGAQGMCRDCWSVWAPVVTERWIRLGVAQPGMTFEMLGNNLV